MRQAGHAVKRSGEISAPSWFLWLALWLAGCGADPGGASSGGERPDAGAQEGRADGGEGRDVDESENRAPVALDDIVYVEAGQAVSVDVLANDADPDGDALRLVGVRLGRGGAASFEGGAITYEPLPSFQGADRVGYTLRDAQGAEAQAALLIGVGVESGAPLAFPDYATMSAGQARSLALLQNDVSPDGSPLEVSWVRPFGRLIANLEDGGVLAVSAPEGFQGADDALYEVVDAQGRVARAEVQVTVYGEPVGEGAPQVELPRTSILPRELAVVVNVDHPGSAAEAAYYMAQRQIPAENLIEVSLGVESVVPPEVFAPVVAEVERALPEGVQAYALFWTAPFRVGCMSMTSAFALGGYDDRYCNTSNNACSTTAPLDYFNSASTRPVEDHGVRPAMMVAGASQEAVRALIDRGVRADLSAPGGEGFLVRTSDAARNVRWPDFEAAQEAWDASGALSLTYIDNADGGGSDLIEGADDVLFYFTGLTRVGGLESLTFKPGAVADHLTSFGGVLRGDSGQMSVLRWLEAGATASYGTTVEPCNYTTKFPQVSLLLDHYVRGATVLEAYWKSVHWPGEGVFVGEPLARPWGFVYRLSFDGEALVLRSSALEPGRTYVLKGSRREGGVYEELQTLTPQTWGEVALSVSPVEHLFYRLEAR